MTNTHELEDGNVWVAYSGNRQPQAYHTRECSHVPASDRRRQHSKAEAKRRGLAECAYCQGNADMGGAEGRQLSTVLERIGRGGTDE